MPSKLIVGVLVLVLSASTVGAVEEASPGGSRSPQRREVKESRRIKQEELRVKLKNVRNERRKELVSRLHERMCQVKDKRVAAVERHLRSMTNILTRVEERTSAVKEKGKDISSVTAAIDKAKAAISTAQAAVEAQAGGDCGLTISSEEIKLTGEVRAAQRALSAQVKSLQRKVVEARHAVQEAIRALAKVLGGPPPLPVSEP